MVDSKISAAQVAAGESFDWLNDQIEALKKGKSVDDGTYIPEANSVDISTTQDQFFGMPPNSFPGQTPLPSTVHAPPVPPVSSTGQTGAGDQTGYTIGQTCPTGQCPVPSAPHASIPASAVPSRTNRWDRCGRSDRLHDRSDRSNGTVSSALCTARFYSRFGRP